MRILSTYLKPAKGRQMRKVASLRLRAGYGISGDANWAAYSPRQILLASRRTYEELGLEEGSLRENVLVDGDVDAFRSGQVLRLGVSTMVRLTIPCEPCVKLNRVRSGLARDVAGRRGFLARVISGGVLAVGEEVSLTDSVFSPIPERPRERVYDLVSHIPSGRTLGFKSLVATAGLPKTYVRVIPRFLTAAPDELPVHRGITTDGFLIPQHLPRQPDRLLEEGVTVIEGRVSENHFWNSTEYFGLERVA